MCQLLNEDSINITKQGVRSQTVKQVSEEKQIPKKAMRKKLSVDKANRKRLWSIVKLSSELVDYKELETNILSSIREGRYRLLSEQENYRN